jgi:hypothetical protein
VHTVEEWPEKLGRVMSPKARPCDHVYKESIRWRNWSLSLSGGVYYYHLLLLGRNMYPDFLFAGEEDRVHIPPARVVLGQSRKAAVVISIHPRVVVVRY